MAALVLSALAGAGWYLFGQVLQSRLPVTLVEDYLSRTLRMDVEVADMTVAASGAMELDGLRARDSEGRELLFAPRTRLQVPPSEALRGRVAVENLVFVGARLTLDAERLKALPKSQEGGGGMPFPIAFEDGTFTWESYTVGGLNGQIAAGLPLALEAQGHGFQSVSAKFEGERIDLRLVGVEEALLRRLGGMKPVKDSGRLGGTAVVDGGKVEANLELETSWATGSIDLKATQTGKDWRGTVKTPKALVAGLGEIRDATVPWSFDGKTLQVQDAVLAVAQGRVRVDGTVGPEGPRLHVRSQGLDVFALAGMPKAEASAAQVDVRLQPSGKVTAFEGQVSWKRLGPASDAWLRGEGVWSRDSVRVSKLQGGRGQAVLLKASGTWVPDVRVDAQVDYAATAALAALFGTWDVQGLPAKGVVEADLKTGTTRGRLQTGAGSVLGTPVASSRLDFQKPKTGPLALGGTVNAMGEELALTAIVPGSLTLSGKDLRLQDLPLVSKRLPGWTGVVDVTFRYDLETKAQRFLLGGRKLRDRGRALPDLALQVKREGDRLVVESGTVGLEPPLPFTGVADLRKGTLKLVGHLKGQSLAKLSRFVPGLAGVTGTVAGKVVVGGSTSRPTVRFEGEVTKPALAGLQASKAQVRVEVDGAGETRLTATLPSVPLGPLLKETLPEASGDARLRVTSAKDGAFAIDAVVPALAWRGERLGQARGRLHFRKGELRAESLTLPLGGKPVVATGLLVPRVSLKARLDGQDLAALAKFMPTGAPEMAGRVTGDLTVQGKAVGFQGKGEGLRLAGQSIGAARLLVDLDAGKGLVEVSGMRAESAQAVQAVAQGLAGGLAGTVTFKPGGKPQIVARLAEGSWKGKALPPVQARATWSTAGLAVSELRGELAPPLVLAGTVAPGKVDLRGELRGSRLSDLLAFAPAGLPALDGVLTGPVSVSGKTLHFEGTLADLAMAGVKLGSGEIAATVDSSGDATRTHLRGSRFDAGQLAPLAARYPGLKGDVSFEGDVAAGTSQFDARLTGATMTAGPVPDLQGSFLIASGVVQIRGLGVAMDPPLNLTGTYDLASGNLTVQGQLQGQSVGDLIRLTGGKPPADMTARLTGPVSLTGTTSAPVARFDGRVTDLALKGVPLGAGQLGITVSGTLDGNLTLDRPVSLGSVGGLAGPLGSFPILQGLMDSTGIQVLGAHLGGTPAEPKVTPRLSGLQQSIGKKLQVPEVFLTLPGSR